MPDDAKLWLLLPAPVRRLDRDLVAVTVLVLVADAVYILAPHAANPVRTLLTLGFVLLLPGYVLLAVIFPRPFELSRSVRQDPERGEAHDGLGPTSKTEALTTNLSQGLRLVLSVPTSAAVVVLLGFAIWLSPFDLTLLSIVLVVNMWALLGTALAGSRRHSVTRIEEGARPGASRIVTRIGSQWASDSRIEMALNVVIVLLLVSAVGGLGYTLTHPSPETSYTELALLTEDETGELVADDYPRSFVRGQPRALTVEITNREHQRMGYTLVVLLQRVMASNEDDRVTEQIELIRFRSIVAANETWQRQHTVAPPLTGEGLRVRYLLYRGEAPASPSSETAYRSVHLRINVSEPGGT
jgi:uncharacterized membrane protein